MEFADDPLNIISCSLFLKFSFLFAFNLTVSNSTLQAETYWTILKKSNSTLIQTVFQNFKSAQNSAIINHIGDTASSLANYQHVYFFNNQGGLIKIMNMGLVNITDLISFRNPKGANIIAPLFSIENSNIILLQNSIIKNAEDFSCINLKGYSSTDSTFKILRTKFENLYSKENGGALYLTDYKKVSIEDCYFINVSTKKSGGVINSKCLLEICNLDVINSTFEETRAQKYGSIMNCEGYCSEILSDNNKFINNVAGIGGKMSSEPVRMIFIIEF
jgi:hypothetical protein